MSTFPKSQPQCVAAVILFNNLKVISLGGMYAIIYDTLEFNNYRDKCFWDTQVGNFFIHIAYTHKNNLRKFLLDETKHCNQHSDENHYFSRQQNGLQCYLKTHFWYKNSIDQLGSEMRRQQCRILQISL